MLNNEIKITDGAMHILCDYHMQLLPVAYKFKGKKDADCELSPNCLEASRAPALMEDVRLLHTHTSMMRKVYIITYKVLDKQQPNCTVICSDCIRNFIGGRNAELTDQKDAPQQYACSHCGNVASIII